MKWIDFDELEKQSDLEETDENWDGSFFDEFKREKIDENEQALEEEEDSDYWALPKEAYEKDIDEKEDELDETYFQIPPELLEEKRISAKTVEQKEELMFEEKEEEDLYSISEEAVNDMTVEEKRLHVEQVLGLRTQETESALEEEGSSKTGNTIMDADEQELPEIDYSVIDDVVVQNEELHVEEVQQEAEAAKEERNSTEEPLYYNPLEFETESEAFQETEEQFERFRQNYLKEHLLNRQNQQQEDFSRQEEEAIREMETIKNSPWADLKGKFFKKDKNHKSKAAEDSESIPWYVEEFQKKRETEQGMDAGDSSWEEDFNENVDEEEMQSAEYEVREAESEEEKQALRSIYAFSESDITQEQNAESASYDNSAWETERTDRVQTIVYEETESEGLPSIIYKDPENEYTEAEPVEFAHLSRDNSKTKPVDYEDLEVEHIRAESAEYEAVRSDSIPEQLAEYETVRADDVQAEPAGYETVRAEEVQAESAGYETVRAEEAQAEPVGYQAVRAEEAQAESVEYEAVRAEDAQAESVGYQAVRVEDAQAKSAGYEAVRAEEAHAESAEYETVRAEEAQAEPAGYETVRAEEVQAEPVGYQAVRVEDAQAESVEYEAVRAEDAQAESVGYQAVRVEDAQAKSAGYEAVRAEEAHAESAEYETVRAEEAQAEPAGYETVRAEEAQAEPAGYETVRAEEAQAESAEYEAVRAINAQAERADSEYVKAEYMRLEPADYEDTEPELETSFVEEAVFRKIELEERRRLRGESEFYPDQETDFADIEIDEDDFEEDDVAEESDEVEAVAEKIPPKIELPKSESVKIIEKTVKAHQLDEDVEKKLFKADQLDAATEKKASKADQLEAAIERKAATAEQHEAVIEKKSAKVEQHKAAIEKKAATAEQHEAAIERKAVSADQSAGSYEKNVRKAATEETDAGKRIHIEQSVQTKPEEAVTKRVPQRVGQENIKKTVVHHDNFELEEKRFEEQLQLQKEERAGVLQKRQIPNRYRRNSVQDRMAYARQKERVQEELSKESITIHDRVSIVPPEKKISKLESVFEKDFKSQMEDDLYVRRREEPDRRKKKRAKEKKSRWEKEADTPDKPIREFMGILISIAVVVAATFILVEYVGQRTQVNGSSMETTLHDGDNLIVDKISYVLREPERFDIVVFPYKTATAKEETYYIKRIIGLPGERVKVSNGYIYINGEQLDEHYGKDNDLIANPGLAEREIQLAENEYFVLGDNRNNSSDSREIGNIKRDDIVGRAWLRIYPFSKIGFLKHQ